MTHDKKRHKEVMQSFLIYCNQRSDKFILKGGTALLFSYGLDRFSEDLDFDGLSRDMENIVSDFCKKHNFRFREAKNTNLVMRYMISYDEKAERPKPLKIEVSLRRNSIPKEEYAKKNGIQVYGINELCQFKTLAYMGRDVLRDMYDICFICNEHFEVLSPITKSIVTKALLAKGIEHFDYITNTQHDDLIDKEALAEKFLSMFDKFDLLTTDEERASLKEEDEDCGYSPSL